MKYIKDKNFYKVSKNEVKSVKGLVNTRKALKIADFNKPLFAGIIVFFVLSLVVSIFTALFTKEILSIFTTHQFEKLYTYAFIFLGLYACSYTIDYCQSRCYDCFKRKFIIDLKSKTMARINSLSVSCFATAQTSTFLRRLGDAQEIVRTFDIVFNSIKNIVISGAYCVILITTSPLLFLICTAFYFVKIILFRFIIPKGNALYKKSAVTGDESHNIALETIRGMNDIKSLNLTDSMQKAYDEKLKLYNSQSYSIDIWWQNRMFPVNFFSFVVNNFVLLLLIAYFCTHEFYAAGSILFFWTYKTNINSFFSALFDIRIKFANIEVAASRMMEIYDETKYPVEKFGKTNVKELKGDIAFNNVSFSYVKDKPILENISFEIKPNTVTAIVGKTGCGKSTTLSLLAKFYDLQSGKITIDGHNIKSLSRNTLRNNIGYVQQNPYILNRSFKENLLLLDPDAPFGKIVDACKKSEIHDFIMSTKDQYDTLIGENGINLSGGQRQRLAIARAFLDNSKIIMFDESTSSLDNENQAKIQSAINELAKDHTIIIVAHRLSTIINADKIIFMENHKIKAEGTHQELFKTCDEYRALYEIENQNK